ncbi:MAG TPA: RNA 2',3'-cyclic phosphodiesterase [Syntrophorhabdales bacterium]|nr:RNA 2',3'-cyclic phosphodiesterase [Syntrophorhabdales bacterium]
MRSFLALEVSAPVVDYLREVIERLSKRTRDVKWVKRDAIHITLKFLGEIEEALAGKMHEALQPIGSRFAPFVVSLKEIDAFPNRRRARVVIVRLDKGADQVKAVYEDVEEGLTEFDFEREAREFTPHITLGRMRTPAAFPDGDLPPLERMEFPVDGLVLFKSTLTPGGAIYSPIWKIKFGGENDEGRSKQDKSS